MQGEEQITEQTIQQFNRVCIEAASLATAYQQQSEKLKQEIKQIVTIHNCGTNVDNIVPIQRIMQITNQYQVGMREVQNQYSELSEELEKEQLERDKMMEQIKDCFNKLERMEGILKEKVKGKVQKVGEILEGKQEGKESKD